MMTVDTPSDEVERSSSIPLMVLTASSILSEISVCAWKAGRHHDGRKIDLWKSVEAQPRERERADDGERQYENRREDGTTNADGSKPLHGRSLLFDLNPRAVRQLAAGV